MTGPIRGGMRVFIVRQEFGWTDNLGTWRVRERRVFGVRQNGAVDYRDANGAEYSANPSHVFRNRTEAHRVAFLLNAAPRPQ